MAIIRDEHGNVTLIDGEEARSVGELSILDFVVPAMWTGFGFWLRKSGHSGWGMFFIVSGLMGAAWQINSKRGV